MAHFEDMHHVHTGSGKPLLLIHGLGGSTRSWDTIVDTLAAEREVIAVDLPGFGETPPLDGAPTIARLADALGDFLDGHDLKGVDVVGSSMGARLVLELARRGRVGATVALDPGGFWTPKEVRIFGASVALSVQLVRAIQKLLPALTSSAAGRTLLLGQFSARPWALPGDVVLRELQSFAAAPAFDSTLHELVTGPTQDGLPAGSAPGKIVIGWGRRDLVTLPRQAHRAARLFPDAELHWFEGSGHFPHWDVPDEAARVILAATAPAGSLVQLAAAG